MEFHQFKSIFGYIEAKSQHFCKIQLKNGLICPLFNKIQFKHLFIFLFFNELNSNIYSIFIFQQNSIKKFIQFSVFRQNSIQKFIQNVEIGCIQFNKIFIQCENMGIGQGYHTPSSQN